MLLAVGLRINSSLSWGGDYSAFRFAVYVVTLIGNYTESNFACLTPINFLFLLAAIGYADMGPFPSRRLPGGWGWWRLQAGWG